MAARRMGLRHVEAFRAVILAGSMTEAARRLNTSQPQISRLISQLETIAKFSLFDRNGSRLIPTLDGSRFFQEVERTFVGLDGLETAVEHIRAFAADRLRVAAMPRLAGGLLTQVVSRFATDHSEVAISIHSGTASSVHNWVKTGLCDAAVAMLYTDALDVQAEPLLRTNCVAVVPRGHRLTQREFLTPEDFAGEEFISFPTGSPLRSRIDQIFSAKGIERKIRLEADLGASICALVAAGLGCGLINPLAAREECEDTNIEIRPFASSLPVVIAMLYPMGSVRSRLVNTFSKYVSDYVAENLRIGEP